MTDSLSAGSFSVHDNVPVNVFEICGDNHEPLVTLHHDGRLVFGPNYEPDEAARIFWNAVRGYMPTTMHPPLAGYHDIELTAELQRRGVSVPANHVNASDVDPTAGLDSR